MDNQKFIKKCKAIIAEYMIRKADKTDKLPDFSDDAIYVVWSCKTLQNNKALLSTTLSDGMYYECTYNGDKEELYFDAYKKSENIKYDLKGGAKHG